MTLSSKLRTPGSLLCLSLFGLATGAEAAPRPQFPQHPAAQTVFEHYISATGGEAAWRSKKTERDEVEGRSLDNGHLVLRATIAMTRQGNILNDVKVPEEAREGVFNGVAWAWTRLSGPRIKRGPEREEAMRGSGMLQESDWRSLFPKSRVDGVETVNGRDCYKVRLLPSADEKTEWFDVETGLLARRSSVALDSGGLTPVSYTVEAWRVRDGLKQPAIMLAVRGDMQYRLSILNVFYNDIREPDDIRYPRQVEDYLKEEKAGKALPNAEEIIERHIFESGGFTAYERLKTQRITGTIEFLSRNLEARTETFSAGDGRYYQSVDIPGLGKQEEGSDGEIAWERSPILGPRSKPRNKLTGLGMTLDAAEVIGWRYLVGEVRTEALETLDGHECYRVRITGRNGAQTSVRWYDRKTGLLYRTSVASKTDMGDVPTVMTYQAWRTVEGLKWPVQILMTVSGQDLLFKAEEVALNTVVDGSVFELPDEIRNLQSPRLQE